MVDSVIGEAMPTHCPERAPGSAEGETPSVRLKRLVDVFFDSIYRAAKRFGTPPSLVDDCVQQVFLVAASKLESIALESERAFLLGTTYRLAKEFRRRVNDIPSCVDSEKAFLAGADSTPDLEEIVDRKRARFLLDGLLAELPDELRVVFVLYEIEGISVPEIAEALDLAEGTAASRLRRARETFERGVERYRAKQRFLAGQASSARSVVPAVRTSPLPSVRLSRLGLNTRLQGGES